jgi:hypothetical protein
MNLQFLLLKFSGTSWAQNQPIKMKFLPKKNDRRPPEGDGL